MSRRDFIPYNREELVLQLPPYVDFREPENPHEIVSGSWVRGNQAEDDTFRSRRWSRLARVSDYIDGKVRNSEPYKVLRGLAGDLDA